jgi:PAS domain S-box-containing protein
VLEHPSRAADARGYLKLIIDRLPVILWSMDSNGRVTACKGRGLSLLGRTANDIVGRSFFDLPDETAETVTVTKEQLQHVLGTGETVMGVRHIGERWHEYHLTPRRAPDGSIVGVLGISLDTTDRARPDNDSHDAHDAQSHLRAILAHAPMILWAADRDGKVVLAEGKGLAALGVELAHGLGKSVDDWGLNEEHRGAVRRALDGEAFVSETAVATRWYDTYFEPLREPSGSPAGTIAVAVDITARKQVEADRDRLFRAARRALLGEQAAVRRATFLAQSSRVLAGSLDQNTTLASIAHLVVPEMADACVVDFADTKGSLVPVVTCRDPARRGELAEIARRFERGPNTVLGRVLGGGAPFYTPRLDAETAKLIAPEIPYPLLERFGLASLVIVAMKARGRVLGLLTLCTRTDSGRQLEQDDVELASDLAVHAALAIDNARLYGEQTLAVQRRDEFLSVASHELRTPVTSVQLAIQALTRLNERSARADEPPHVAAMLQTAERQSRRLAQLVENLLDVSRIATGQLSMQLDRVDFAELVRDTALTLAVDAVQADCAIELDVEGPAIGNWDRVRLEQVIVNLLSNALKYGRGKPVRLSLRTDGGVARLRVEDHGIGIARAAQATIFDRFERAVSARHYGGFGLGLYIVKQIVTALGGSIGVASEPGAGAVFTVTLPLASDLER